MAVERRGRVIAADRPFLYTLQTCIRAQALLRPHVRFISAVLAGRLQRRDQAGQEAALRPDRRLGRCPCEWQCDCRAALRFRSSSLITSQPAVAVFRVRRCAAASGCMFWRWWRLDAYDRQRVWPNYGRFSAVVCVGSVAGAVSAVTWALWLSGYHGADYQLMRMVAGTHVRRHPPVPAPARGRRNRASPSHTVYK